LETFSTLSTHFRPPPPEIAVTHNAAFPTAVW
jgi:hypothetical protein